MCYPKPGPRCSSHARQALRKAAAVAKREESYDAYDKLKKAQEDYNMTPEGIKRLERAYKKTKSDSAKDLLDLNIQRRKDALKAVNLMDYGDVKHGEQDKKWSDITTFQAAHQAGLEAYEEAKSNGYHDLVETKVEGTDGLIASRAYDYGGGVQSVVFKPGALNLAVRGLVQSTVRDQAVLERESHGTRLDSSVYRIMYDRTGNGMTHSYRSGYGAAYDNAFAATLRKEGVEAHAETMYLPESPSKLYNFLHRKAERSNLYSDARPSERRVLNEASDSLRNIMLEHKEGDSSQNVYAKFETFAKHNEEKTTKAGLKAEASAWKEVAALARWSSSAHRREA